MGRVQFSILIMIGLFSPLLVQASPGFSLGGNTNIIAGHPKSSTSVPDTSDSRCSVIDFEGVGNLNQIGVITGSPTVTFGTSWLGSVDQDAGGSGNFANEPSASTSAFFLDTDNHTIDFDSSVQFVEVFYSAAASSVPVTLRAYDGPNGTGTVVDTAIGNVIGTDYDGAICTGDPTGNFCAWRIIELTTATNNIRSITLSGALENYIGFDNMRFCVLPKYVALGDSYSSGEGAESYKIDLDGDQNTDGHGENTDQPNNKCHRSKNAYAWRSLTMHDITATEFFACSGAVTINVRSSGQGQGYDAPDNEPQLQQEPIDENTELVTITIGGNDARFADILKWCLLHSDCASYDPWGSVNELGVYMPQLITDVVSPAIQTTLEDIKTQAPNAQIYLLGYPRIFPSEGSDCAILRDRGPGYWEWAQEEQVWINSLGAQLNEAQQAVASAANINFIPVNQIGLFPGHELCQTESWLREPDDLNNPEIFHPTDIGQLRGYRLALENRLLADQNNAHQVSGRAVALPKIQGEGTKLQVSILPTIGTLRVTAVNPVCDSTTYPPGQSLEIIGEGYEEGAQVTLNLTSSDGTQQIGVVSAEPTGNFLINVNLPSHLSESGLALLEARGMGANSAPRTSTGSFAIGPGLGSDSDLDGLPDTCDLCPINADPGQEDSDADGKGDACDICPLDPANDSDSDGLCADTDPCPMDPSNDADGDGRCAVIDNCPNVYNPNQLDSDGDLFGDACDICPGSNDIGCAVFKEVCGGVDETLNFGITANSNIVCSANHSISMVFGFFVEKHAKFQARIVK